MKLRKTLLILSASAMLGAAVIASDVALAQPFPGPPPGGPPPGPVGGPPPGMAGGGVAVSLVRGVLRGLGRRWPSSTSRRRRARGSCSSRRIFWSPGGRPSSSFRRGGGRPGFSGGHGSAYGRSGTYAYGHWSLRPHHQLWLWPLRLWPSGYGSGDNATAPSGTYVYSNSSELQRLLLYLQVQLPAGCIQARLGFSEE